MQTYNQSYLRTLTWTLSRTDLLFISSIFVLHVYNQSELHINEIQNEVTPLLSLELSQTKQFYGILPSFLCYFLVRHAFVKLVYNPRHASNSRRLVPTFHWFSVYNALWLGRWGEVERIEI